MITVDAVTPLLLGACPSFKERWSTEFADDPIHLGDDGTRLSYLDAMEFARHLIRLLKGRSLDEIEAAFRVIERLHLEGDHDVEELATIGYLESVQNHADHDDEVQPADFEPFLGPESLRWWKGLDRFWAAETPVVLPAED